MTADRPARNHRRITGIGRVLVVVYAILALGATGRSFVQIVERYDQAPLAFTLSGVSAVVYILATLALIFSASRLWYRIAWVTICFELVGVLAIGTLSLIQPTLFPEATVWSYYGIGYLFVPLVLPFCGLWWLIVHPPARRTHTVDAAAPTTTKR